VDLLRRAAAVALVVAAGCRTLDDFVCANDAACVRAGVSGRCEASSRCSFPDGECAPSGRRYGALAGARSNECVGSDEGGIALRGKSVKPRTMISATQPLVVDAPAGLRRGELLFAAVSATSTDGGLLAVPSGWQPQLQLLYDGESPAWFYRVAGDSEPASFEFPITQGTAAASAVIVAYGGVAVSQLIDGMEVPRNPVDAERRARFGEAEWVTSFEAPGVTTSQPNELTLAMFSKHEDLSGWSHAGDAREVATTSTVAVYDRPEPVAGPTAAITVTLDRPSNGSVEVVTLKSR
jgi:hypothetical protein